MLTEVMESRSRTYRTRLPQQPLSVQFSNPSVSGTMLWRSNGLILLFSLKTDKIFNKKTRLKLLKTLCPPLIVELRGRRKKIFASYLVVVVTYWLLGK